MGRKITIALAGNPNSGKTTLFNGLTHARQHVGNYPGVTVEKKEGTCRHRGVEITVVDLPGTYSLTAHSIEEVVARDFIIEEKPDVVVDIVDASNLERNLYLATQFMELDAPLVLAFNMSDVADSRGLEFDLDKLSALLGAPIVPTVGHKGRGMTELLDVVVEVAEQGKEAGRRVTVGYGQEIEEEIGTLQEHLEDDGELVQECGPRWVAVKLLENDEDVWKKVPSERIRSQVRKSAAHLEGIFGDPPEVVLADRRYGFISGACQQAVRSTVEARHTMSDRIDAVVTHRILGVPIFLGLMWLVFQLTFTLGEAPMRWVESATKWLGGVLGRVFPEGMLNSLVVDGIVGGVGGILVFVPIIMLLFLAIAFLEDSGYMARAAFIMDRVMNTIGLHGKSFIPMLLGFGCGVPAIMATRTLESRRDRLVTMLVIPLMSCGARLPVYALFIAAFFDRSVASYVLFSLYMLGIVLAIAMAKLFRRVLLPGPAVPFVMELPPYRVPTVRGVVVHMWERAWIYIKRAGTILMGVSIILWCLSNFPSQVEYSKDYEREKQALEASYQGRIAQAKVSLAGKEDSAEAATLEKELDQMAREKSAQINALNNTQKAEKLEKSFAGRIGHALAVPLRPLGLGHWRVGVALFSGFAAKEVVVSTLGTLYNLGETEEGSVPLRTALREDPLFTPLRAYTLMVFVLIYLPCMVTIAVLRRETGSWRWPIFTAAYLTALAWVVSFLVYQGGKLLGLGT